MDRAFVDLESPNRGMPPAQYQLPGLPSAAPMKCDPPDKANGFRKFVPEGRNSRNKLKSF